MKAFRKRNKFICSHQLIFTYSVLWQGVSWHKKSIGDYSYRPVLYMLRKLNTLLIVGMSFFYFPAHSKDMSKNQELRSSNLEEIAEEMTHLNANLESLTTTVSNLFPRRRLESNLWYESSNDIRKHWNNWLAEAYIIQHFSYLYSCWWSFGIPLSNTQYND